MVEFPLLVRWSARGFATPARNLSQIPPLDINFVSSRRHLTQAGMWEPNTFIASFHARLNVAPQHDSRDAATRQLRKIPNVRRFMAIGVNFPQALLHFGLLHF